jgi:hypothetical protein
MHLKATDLVKLKKNNMIVTNLGAFICQAVFTAQNNNEDT